MIFACVLLLICWTICVSSRGPIINIKGAFAQHKAPVITTTQAECELPPCELVRKSRLFSERCRTKEAAWPLLITGTPRSATVFMTESLRAHGAQIHDDWSHPFVHGSVSWIFAFEDDNNFGPGRTDGYKFKHVLHQVRDPLKSITSMCTEPLFNYRPTGFLEKHINYSFAHEDRLCDIRSAMQFWVEWHDFLDKLRLPVFRVEDMDPLIVFDLAGLSDVYKTGKVKSSKVNSRKHRDTLTWQELFTASPHYTKRMWSMATRYGYTSTNPATFRELRCGATMPTCMVRETKAPGGRRKKRDELLLNIMNSWKQFPSPFCPPGTHPATENTRHYSGGDRVTASLNISGLADPGCVEYKTASGEFIGIRSSHWINS